MATQLQAKDRDGMNQRFPVTMDGITKADIDWLIKFSKENLNVHPSFTVVLRAALCHYRSYLIEQASSGIKDLDSLTQFIQDQRDLMFFVSGRPENAKKKPYQTTTTKTN